MEEGFLCKEDQRYLSFSSFFFSHSFFSIGVDIDHCKEKLSLLTTKEETMVCKEKEKRKVISIEGFLVGFFFIIYPSLIIMDLSLLLSSIE